VAAVVPTALLRKSKRFGRLGLVIVLSHGLGGIVAIVLALHGWGTLSLAIKAILSAILIFASTLVLSRTPLRLRLDASLYRAVAEYAGYQLLFQFVYYFSRNLDKLLVGRYLGQASLGYYEKSYRLMLLPLQTFSQVISPVLHPVLSGIQDDKERIARALLSVTRVLALIGFPLAVFLSFSAKEIVLLVFGSQWDRSVSVFAILAWSVGWQMVQSPSGSILQALGRTDLLFVTGLISAVLLAGGVVAGLLQGTTDAVATALLVAFTLNFFQGTVILVVIALRSRYSTFLRALGGPFATGTAVYGSLWLARYLLDFGQFSLFASLLVKGLVALVTFLVITIGTGQVRHLKEQLRL
jgi:PST family polysaccharide transporter